MQYKLYRSILTNPIVENCLVIYIIVDCFMINVLK